MASATNSVRMSKSIKLELQVSRFNFALSIAILMLGAILLFFLIRFEMNQMDRQKLSIDARKISRDIANGISIADLQKENRIEVRILPTESDYPTKPRFSTIYIPPNPIKQARKKNDRPLGGPPPSNGTYMQLQVNQNINGQWYYITTRQIPPFRGPFYAVLAFTIGLVFFGLLVTLYWGNKLMIRRILQPLHEVVNTIDQFNINTEVNPKYQSTSDIEEFEVLQKKTAYLMERSKQEYRQLKEFSENASHELQTPLAVISAKLDILMQSENLGQTDLMQIDIMQVTIQKMRQMNKTLLLINKIENREFTALETTNIKQILENLLTASQELMGLKKLSLTTKIETVTLQANSYIIELLLSNLLSNAIRHNVQDGTIDITLNSDGFNISNTGQPLPFSADLLFTRFKKPNQSSSNNGLGLAIVKRICNTYNYKISYQNVDNEHLISLKW